MGVTQAALPWRVVSASRHHRVGPSSYHNDTERAPSFDEPGVSCCLEWSHVVTCRRSLYPQPVYELLTTFVEVRLDLCASPS